MRRRDELTGRGLAPHFARQQAYSEVVRGRNGRARQTADETSTGPASLIPPIPEGFLRATKAMFEGKPAETLVESLRWAARHAMVEDVEAGDANSAAALCFLGLARTDQAAFASLLAKLLPSRSELDARPLFEDDGRDLDLIAMNRRLRETFKDVMVPESPSTGVSESVSGNGHRLPASVDEASA